MPIEEKIKKVKTSALSSSKSCQSRIIEKAKFTQEAMRSFKNGILRWN